MVVRDLSISPRSAPPVALLDSIARLGDRAQSDTSARALELTGTATVTGMVRGAGAVPLAGVAVRVRDARSSTFTDSAGKFILGDLPAGTQILQTLHAGYPLTEVAVELRPGRSTEQNVLMVRNVGPDSARSDSTLYKEFDAHRRAYAFGQFLGVEEVVQKEKASPRRSISSPTCWASPRSATARGARLISNEALADIQSCRSANDRRRRRPTVSAINDIAPSQVGAIEAYANSQFVPERFAGHGRSAA